ncbi:Transglutaminase-like superfamily protein [Micromonospora yangpuensis]|uniref:Transglutaminase-like superfamily protein n=2 Tax=Micromonospora yangpuensis TaxID=683228 RepID=A0A1C6UQU5_9ACTN|nr:Transglutaminase-like superfamily protein [Micromonospora yangpuensis]
MVRTPGAVLRMHRRGGMPAVRTALWAVRSVRLVRRQLVRRTMAEVHLPAPPPGAAGQRTVLLGALRRSEANCLERSLVLQRWYGGQRIARTVVIGVTAPSTGFHAHAWLDGEPDGEAAAMTEILRRPAPPAWLAAAGEP